MAFGSAAADNSFAGVFLASLSARDLMLDRADKPTPGEYLALPPLFIESEISTWASRSPALFVAGNLSPFYGLPLSSRGLVNVSGGDLAREPWQTGSRAQLIWEQNRLWRVTQCHLWRNAK